jgi:hypothetical protein
MVKAELLSLEQGHGNRRAVSAMLSGHSSTDLGLDIGHFCDTGESDAQELSRG